MSPRGVRFGVCSFVSPVYITPPPPPPKHYNESSQCFATSKHTVNQCVPAPCGSVFEMATRFIMFPDGPCATVCIAFAIWRCTKALLAMMGKLTAVVGSSVSNRGVKAWGKCDDVERTRVGVEETPSITSKTAFCKCFCKVADEQPGVNATAQHTLRFRVPVDASSVVRSLRRTGRAL